MIKRNILLSEHPLEWKTTTGRLRRKWMANITCQTGIRYEDLMILIQKREQWSTHLCTRAHTYIRITPLASAWCAHARSFKLYSRMTHEGTLFYPVWDCMRVTIHGIEISAKLFRYPAPTFVTSRPFSSFSKLVDSSIFPLVSGYVILKSSIFTQSICQTKAA